MADSAQNIGVPPLADFLRWAAEMPGAFKDEPARAKVDGVSVRAVVSDLVETLNGARPEQEFLRAFSPAKGLATNAEKVERNRLRWVLAGCHVLWHPSFRG